VETLALDGLCLAYWQQGSGPPVLFVHGVGASGELWVRDIGPLARDCRLIVYDRRGYGGSSESPRDWQAHRKDAVALIEALEPCPPSWWDTAAARSSRWISRSSDPTW